MGWPVSSLSTMQQGPRSFVIQAQLVEITSKQFIFRDLIYVGSLGNAVNSQLQVNKIWMIREKNMFKYLVSILVTLKISHSLKNCRRIPKRAASSQHNAKFYLMWSLAMKERYYWTADRFSKDWKYAMQVMGISTLLVLYIETIHIWAER